VVGYLHGKVLSKNLETLQIILGNENVGYEVTLTAPHFDRLPLGETASVWIHTHVREDILQLYGFHSENERHFFRVLPENGSGPFGRARRGALEPAHFA
jgi:Holliday junction DNA helicase RuvA